MSSVSLIFDTFGTARRFAESKMISRYLDGREVNFDPGMHAAAAAKCGYTDREDYCSDELVRELEKHSGKQAIAGSGTVFIAGKYLGNDVIRFDAAAMHQRPEVFRC